MRPLHHDDAAVSNAADPSFNLSGQLTGAVNARLVGAGATCLPISIDELDTAVRRALLLAAGRRNLLITRGSVAVMPGPVATHRGVAPLGRNTFVVSLDVVEADLVGNGPSA
jgi:hypothetical protein